MIRPDRRAKLLAWVAGVGVSALVAFACGEDAESMFTDPRDAGASDARGPFPDGGAPAVVPANGLVIVHAASLPAFRLCFDADKSRQPLPSDQLMPSSNIAGVEVGTAVRIDPLSRAIGRVWAFPEPAIRTLYPPGRNGPSCADLLDSLADAAVDLGEIDRDLSTGVHLLVVSGCRASSADPAASTERCGPTWTVEAGNVGLRVISIEAFRRSDPTSLPLQIVQLSSALASRTGGRRLSVALGELDAASPEPFITDEMAFGDVVPDMPMPIDYRPEDTASFASVGFHVSAEPADAGDDAGAELLLRQSLAEVARLSSSRDVPPAWFAAASSYVLLLLGEPDLEADASADDRRRVHLLAVPVAAPQDATTDAGADAGAPN